MKTFSVKSDAIEKKWYTVDASDKSLGRLASEIAYFLRGKNKPTFTPHLDTGDCVIVINAEKIKLTGKKWDDKIYYHHSGYIGGIKAIRAKDLLAKHPERLIEKAVKGMLPKNKLARQIAKNLRVYGKDVHPHAGQDPQQMPSRTA
jgi:large subunit ribosomal protein L13